MENKYELGMPDLKKQLNGKTPAGQDSSKKMSGPELESHFVDDLAERYDSAKKATTEAYDTTIDRVKRNPLSGLAAAAGVGALLGFFLGRRK